MMMLRRRRRPPPSAYYACRPTTTSAVLQTSVLALILLHGSLVAAVNAGPPGSIPEVRRFLNPAGEAAAAPAGDDWVGRAPLPPGRGGRAELIDPGCCWDESDVDRLRDADPLDALLDDHHLDDVSLGGAGVRRRTTNTNDELHLALPSAPSRWSSSSDVGTTLSIEALLSRPMKWNIAPNLIPNRHDADPPPLNVQPPSGSYRKTGTTIVGCLADSGTTVVIAADTRATDGTTVADARCEKVHRLADNVWCCGAGTSGDIDALVRRAKYTFLLRGMIRGSIGNGVDGDGQTLLSGADEEVEEQLRQWLPTASVSSVVRFLRDTLYESRGNIGANLVLGGYDLESDRAVLAAVHPHGSVDSVPYLALGSGGLAAMSVLESRYRPDVTVEDAIKIVREAVGAGITNDLGSGSQIDLCVIGPEGVTYKRGVVAEEELPVTEGGVAADALLRARHSAGDSEGAIMNGVNGFGSLPYSIKSRRVVVRNEEIIERDRRESIEKLLNLD